MGNGRGRRSKELSLFAELRLETLMGDKQDSSACVANSYVTDAYNTLEKQRKVWAKHKK